MRLFTALVPPPAAVEALVAALAGPVPAGWRRVDPATWHVTLAFHGDADPAERGAALDTVRGLAAPRLRIEGAGAFPGVAWAAVTADPPAALLALVSAVGGDAAAFVPHLTVLRRRGRRRPDPPACVPQLVGPWWRADEVLLVASARTETGPRHEVVHRVALAEG